MYCCVWGWDTVGTVLSPTQWFSTGGPWPKNGSQVCFGSHDSREKNNAQCSQQNKALKGNKKTREKGLGICYKPDSNTTNQHFISLFHFTHTIFEGVFPWGPCKGSQLSSRTKLYAAVKFKVDSFVDVVRIDLYHSYLFAIYIHSTMRRFLLCHHLLQRLHPSQLGSYSEEGRGAVKLDAHLISGSLRALYKKEREKTHTYIL